jgi:hypothetical protein
MIMAGIQVGGVEGGGESEGEEGGFGLAKV